MKKPINRLKTSRKIHKWLMLFLGAQFVIWSVTGAYMVFFDIDYIHGDSLVINHQDKINPDNIDYTLKDLMADYPQAQQVSLGKFIDKEVYRFSLAGKSVLLDASDGLPLSPLDNQAAQRAAEYYYSGDGQVNEVELITDNPPFELSARALPAWRVNFDNFASPSIYVSADSGLLVGKRHEFWRLFDWMFRFHVMDYGDAEEIDNMLLFWVCLFAIIACVFGLVLVYYRVFKVTGKQQSHPIDASPKLTKISREEV
tara:strand:+ start:5779 stop:6546 length:768 start_codon:yes stop_codon:yes gene_type:complete